MIYSVQLIREAEQDLLDIVRFILLNDSPAHAGHVHDQLMKLCCGLSTTPERGHFPPELERIGVREYKELHFKPYRVIYSIEPQTVFVQAILDGRRDLRDLLEYRMLR